ncbi:hypothetical protein O6H91_11G007500 [Diphasiastrum complanatum]|uniref:Uncharacterized protein n=1 Tax=Diphasiastrum complanatum TaxID=34168 RepID=A0ACC2C679_DIPCM|nr:hypothetical protein O6H91_11G007500 [Diphasiastrum complanatum]
MVAAAGLVAVERRDEGGCPQLDEAAGERIELVQPNVGIVLGDHTSSYDGDYSGTLYITTRQLIWLSDRDLHRGYAVDFLSLAMHAISRDTGAYPLPCIYTQIERGDNDEYEIGEDEDEESEESEITNSGDLSKVSEMRLVPADSNALESIFQVLCACAALNPDPEGDEVLAGGLTNINILSQQETAEGLVQDSRFEDAEEELEDG